MSLPAVKKALLTQAGSAHADTTAPFNSGADWERDCAVTRQVAVPSADDLEVWYDSHPPLQQHHQLSQRLIRKVSVYVMT